MTVQQFGDLYTSGNGEQAKAVCYNLENLNLMDCLVRVNKVSDNGVALSVAVTLTADFESKVSKAGVEKGQSPIKLGKGEVLVFECNVSVKDDRKPDEVNGRCQTLINGLRGSMLKDGKTVALSDTSVIDGSIINLTWDGQSVPLKGIQKVNSFKEYLSDKDESIIYIELLDLGEGEMSEMRAAELEALQGSKYVERAAYQKGKTYEQLFLERLDYAYSTITNPDSKVMEQITALTGEFPVWSDETTLWEYPVGGAIEGVILGMLKV